MKVKMKEKIKKWCEEEEILKQEVEDPNSEFNFAINFPDKNHVLNVIQPKEKDYVFIISRTVITSEDREKLREKEKERYEELLWDLRFTLGNRPTQFNLTITNNILQDFTITYRIYSDGLTKHNLMQAIREVHKSKLLAIWKMMYALK